MTMMISQTLRRSCFTTIFVCVARVAAVCVFCLFACLLVCLLDGLLRLPNGSLRDPLAHTSVFCSFAVTMPNSGCSNSHSSLAARGARGFSAVAGGVDTAASSCIVKNVAVPKLQNGMDYVQLGDSDLVVSKVCSTFAGSISVSF